MPARGVREESMFWRTDTVQYGGTERMLGNEAEEAAGTLTTSDRVCHIYRFRADWGGGED